MHRVLVVDDEKDILDMVCNIMEDKFSCETDKASNGLDAFILAQKNNYDLIITDHNMPFMKGSALVIGIRTKETSNKATPIIMLSAYIEDKLRETLKVQNVEFIEKPFVPVEFIQLVRDILI
jgi:two-component system chemotaxis response regulator CheY